MRVKYPYLNSQRRGKQMTNTNDSLVSIPTLYVVPTPIGNLGDITQRAIDVLHSVDLIAAEDTRHTNKLLKHFNISTKTFALHDHNEQQKAQVLIDKLHSGQSIALVSDAGTPLISDPGYHLVNQCRQANIKVVPLPGPCALITALSASGLPSDRFSFEGFLPAKSKGRKDKLQEIASMPHTCIFYESPHRILDSLADMVEILGQHRQVVLARELTKTFETIKSLPLGELRQWVSADGFQQKGEMVLLIHGFRAESEHTMNPEIIKLMTLLNKELPLKKAASITSACFDVKKNDLYKWGLEHLT